jgi:putative transposase/transposase-like zinc-binding protein
VCESPHPKPGARRLELAQIFREHGEAYRRAHRLCAQQRRVMQAIEDCRTAALGGHLEACDRCGAEIARYHSCRNRHCPKCQTLAKERWVEVRTAELLPVPYFHLVFTLPHAINPLAQGNPKVIYHLLFQAASNTLQSFGRDPKWLGGEIGITMVLHTWGQNLSQHLHVHCVVSGGALAPEGRWIPAKRGFLFPVRALSVVFRAKYLEALEGAFEAGQLDFAGETTPLAEPSAFPAFLAKLRAKDWVVYAKPPFGGPEQVLAYLGRYTHRIPSATSASWDAKTGKSASATEIMPTATRPRRCAYPPRNSSVGFSFMSSPTASCASGTTASSPIATAPSTWPPAGPRSMRRRQRLPNPKRSRPSSLGCSEPMSTAARTVVKDGCARFRALPPLPRATGPPLFRCAA